MLDHQVRPSTSLSLLTAGLVGLWLLLATLPAHAADDHVIVSRQEAQTTFALADLLANDPEPILDSFSPPSRGQLQLEGESFVYTPSPAFLEYGSDSFRYRFGPDPEEVRTVFLVADLKNSSENAFEGSWPLPTDWQPVLSAGNRIEPAPHPVTNSPAPLIEYSGQGVAFLWATRDQDQPSSPSGGDTVVVLVPPELECTLPQSECDALVENGEMVFAAILGKDDEPLFELLLTADGMGTGHHSLQARGYQDTGPPLETSPQPVVVGTSYTVELSWWQATAPAARDGGLLLRLDGQLVDTVTGIANAEPELASWAYGIVEEFPGLTIHFPLLAFETWTAERGPIFPPFFSDGGEEGHLEVWQEQSRPDLLAATTAAALSGARGLEIAMPSSGTDLSPPYLTDRSPSTADGGIGAHSYRARFQLASPGLWPPVNSSLNLLRGRDGSGGKPFLVKLRHSGDGIFQVRALGQQDDGSFLGTPWVTLANPLDGSGVLTTLEVQWWAAAADDAGGLRLWVDGLGTPELHLDNGGGRLLEVELGAAGLPPGTAGILYLDAFESWR